MTLFDIFIAQVEEGGSQEDCQTRDYAENRINSMSNFQFLDALSEALEEYEDEKLRCE